MNRTLWDENPLRSRFFTLWVSLCKFIHRPDDPNFSRHRYVTRKMWSHTSGAPAYIRNPDPLSRLIQVIRSDPVVSWSFSDRFVFIRGREVRVGKFFLWTTQYQGPGAARGKEIEEENKNQWRPRAIIVPLWLLVANDLIKFPQKSKVAPNLNSKSCQATCGWGYRWAQSDRLMSRLSGPIQKSARGK